MDASGPCVKGLTLSSVADDVNALLQKGRIARPALEKSLQPQDFELLDGEVIPGLWYPVDAYERLLGVLWNAEGNGRPDYLVARGEAAAERILAAGAYASLVETAQKWGGDHVAKSIVNLSKGLYNFMEWTLEGEWGKKLEIHARDAGHYPDVARFAAEGFIRVLLARSTDRSTQVTSRRPTADHVVFAVSHDG